MFSFVNSYEESVKKVLEDHYFAQVNFESARQGFLELACNSVQVVAKAICCDFEEVLALTGTREWRDTEDPYMDAICDTIVDYIENDVKAFIDPDYHNEIYKQCVNRVVLLYISAILAPTRNKASFNENFLNQLLLEKQILYDFGMEYIGFEKVCFLCFL